MSRLRTAITGLAALTGLALIIVGVPFLLIALAGNPLPGSWPSPATVGNALSRLTGDATILLGLLKYAAWAAWAWFTLTALAQIVAQVTAQVTAHTNARARHDRRPGDNTNGTSRAPSAARPARAAVPKVVDVAWIGQMVAAALALFTLVTIPTLSATATTAAATTTPETGGGPAAAAGSLGLGNHPGHQPGQQHGHGLQQRYSSTTSATSSSTTKTVAVPRIVTVHDGDTLSEISQEQYGDAGKWPKIFKANRGAPQGHGQHLQDPDLIYSGLKLTIPGKHDTVTRAITPSTTPAAPTNPTDPTVRDNPPSSTTAPPATSSTTPTREPAPGSETGHEQAGSGNATAPAPRTQPATRDQLPPASENLAGDARSSDAAEVTEAGDSAAVVRTVTGLGSIAAAGALALLSLRRSRQSRTRRPGQRINLPSGEAAITEAQLRATADPVTVSDVDLALRTMAHNAIHAGMPIPGLRAARITSSAIELYLTDPDSQLPQPFAAVEDPGVWVLQRDELDGRLLDATTAALTPAPYPTLVTIGHDEDEAHLLLNVEELRTLAITGPDELASPVLAAIALELIASQWADAATITLVGVLPELADALGAGNVTFVETLEEILASLEHAARVTGEEMLANGVDTPEQARAAGLNADAWTPHLIITAAAPTGAQHERIQAILQASPRTSVAAVNQGNPMGEWQLHLTGLDRAELQPQQIPLTPQRLEPDTLARILDGFRAADVEHHDGPEWTDGIAGEIPLDEIPDALPDAEAPQADEHHKHLDEHGDGHGDGHGDPSRRGPDTAELEAIIDPEKDLSHLVDAVPTAVTTLPTTGPVLRLLGPSRLDNPQGKAPTAPRTALKILAHLALAPGGHHDELDRAVWPGQEIRTNTRSSSLSVTRRWVGHHEADGHPYLAMHTDDAGYRLAEDLPVDWVLFQQLVGTSIAQASTQDLADALHLVYGTPMSNAHLGDAHHEAEMIFAIADVAHELAERYIHAGKPRAAMWAAGRGLDVARETETLWRDMLRASHQLREPERITRVITHLTAHMNGLGVDLEPETEELITQITTPKPARTHAHV